MSDLEIYRSKPRQARKYMEKAISSNLVPFLQSSPGIGKSSITHDIAKKYNLKVIDHRLSTSAPEDLSGLPHFITDPQGVRKASFVPFDLFPLSTDPVPEGYDGWMIFFDEFNSAPREVQAAGYKIILDRMVGQNHLNDRVVMACAGNLASDKAITNDLSTAMQSRLVHIEMEHDFDQWHEDVAIKHNYDMRIRSYLNYRQSELMDFRPEHNEKTFCCPRTWEFMNRLVVDTPTSEMDDWTGLYAGTITSASAISFVAFTKLFNNIPNIRDIVANPQNCFMPSDVGTRFATTSHLLEQVTAETLGACCTYVNRMSMEVRLMFYRTLMIIQPTWRKTPVFAQAMVDLTQYLNSTD